MTSRLRMNTTLVINSKGGVGKTTIATNLAGFFAANGTATAIMDYDPQGSSMNWISRRPSSAGRILAANAAPQTGGLRSLSMYVPADTQQLIVDAPAGASRLLQQDMLRNVNYVVIPVAPSAIDIHATANFIKELLLQSCVRLRGIQVGVVANRARNSRPIYAPLERFLGSLGMPFLTRLMDSEIYLDAAENGVGIFEMDESVSGNERAEFMPIVEWVLGRHGTECGHVVELASTRAEAGRGQ